MRTPSIKWLVLAMSAGNAWAQMPRYDVEAWCRTVAASGGAGVSQILLDGCHRQEQSPYDELKPTWDGL